MAAAVAGAALEIAALGRSRSGSTAAIRIPYASTKHLRRVVVPSGPAHFEIPCLDPICVDGGHELTNRIMRALRAHASTFEGEDVCHGSVGTAVCGRMLRFAGVATYRSCEMKPRRAHATGVTDTVRQYDSGTGF